MIFCDASAPILDNQMPKFYIVATPIGNLKDISLRALETLKMVDLILCEDTRVTQKLLANYRIKKPTISYHQHSKLNKAVQIAELLKTGRNLALVSDAGTPGISDPGNRLVDYISKITPQVEIISIPGPSALTSAASIAGFPMARFLFFGFLPRKKNRSKFIKEIIDSKYPVIFYESPYRIIKTLEEIKAVNSDSEVVVCRELTKRFETIYRGIMRDIVDKVKKDPLRGEYTVIMRRN